MKETNKEIKNNQNSKIRKLKSNTNLKSKIEELKELKFKNVTRKTLFLRKKNLELFI